MQSSAMQRQLTGRRPALPSTAPLVPSAPRALGGGWHWPRSAAAVPSEARCADASGRSRLRPCALFVPPSSTTTGQAHTAEAQQQHSPHSCPLDDIESVLFSEQAIKQRVEELGGRLAAEYRGKAPLVLGVLTGAFQFTGDLVRAMQPPPRGIQVNFVRASSYGSGTSSSGEVKLKVDIAPEVVAGRHVLLVEDIVDTGLTLTRLRRYLLEECKAASCCIVTLLDKRERRKVPLVPDYTGFECPNEFVVGYGLDYDEEHRTLPFIGVLKPSCYAHKS